MLYTIIVTEDKTVNIKEKVSGFMEFVSEWGI